MSLYIPKMTDNPGITIPGIANNFNMLEGSLIEMGGDDANGYYARWESGLQVCWKVGIDAWADFAFGTSPEKRGIFYMYNDSAWSYPVPFIAVPAGMTNFRARGTDNLLRSCIVYINPSLTSANLRPIGDMDINSTNYYSIYVIGLWK